MIVHREAGVEDDVVESVQRGSAEAVLFRLRGERRGGGEGGDAEDEIVVRIDVTIQREVVSGGVPDVVFEIEVRAVGAFEGEHFAAGHAEFLHRAIAQALIEMLVRVFLHGKAVLLEKREVLDEFRGFVEVHQHADPAAIRRREHGAQQADEIERRELALLGMKQDFFAQIGGQRGGGGRHSWRAQAKR